ncbi:hypothetical protein ZOSMA_6518G00010, partial [Zostera marina]
RKERIIGQILNVIGKHCFINVFSLHTCCQRISILNISRGGSDFSSDQTETTDTSNCISYKFREFICGDEAINISSSKPYCLCHPIRRGHLNVSQHYSMHQAGLLVFFEVLLLNALNLRETN